MHFRSSAALLLAAALALAGGRCASADGTDAPDPAAWIEKLASEKFDERDEAFTKLAALGEPARAVLSTALAAPDLDERASARRLLALLDRAVLKITLVDRGGKPVEGAEANLQFWDPRQGETQNVLLRSDAAGMAEVRNIKPGPLTLYFSNWRKAQPLDALSASVFIRGGVTPMLLTVRGAGTVKTSLRGSDGKPAREGEVALYTAGSMSSEALAWRGTNAPNMRPPVASALCDAQGNITLDGVNEGVYQCIARGTGQAAVQGPIVRVREGLTETLPPLTLNPTVAGKCTLLLRTRPESTPAKPEPETAVLKSAKVLVEDDYLFDGPDADKKFRAALTERMTYNRYRRAAQLSTDDNGALSLEDLRPGRHRIRIKHEEFAQSTLIVDVPPAGAVEQTVTLTHGGTIKGSAMLVSATASRGNTRPEAFPILETEAAVAELPPELLSFLRGQGTWSNSRSYMTWLRSITFGPRSDTSSNESVMLSNIAPGTYSVLVAQSSSARAQQVYLVCGVKVEEGKIAELPPLKFTQPAQPAARAAGNSGDSLLRGKLLGLSREQAERTTIQYQTQNMSTSTICGSDGTFMLHTSGMDLTGTLQVRARGFKVVEIDCSAPGFDVGNIQIKLEPLTYGGLRVKLVDEAGAPLRDVLVDPAPNPNQNIRHDAMRRADGMRRSTDAAGEARFSGLSVGMRLIDVYKEGYYLADTARVTILADVETTTVLTMRTGLVLSGRVSVPAGGAGPAALGPLAVTLSNKTDGQALYAPVNEAGEFSIAGLTPDTYLLAINGPLYASREDLDINLLDGSKTGLTLEVVRKGGVVLRLDKALKGRAIRLVPQYDQPEKIGETAAPSITATVDGEGRAEFRGIRTMRYRVALQPPAQTSRPPADCFESIRFSDILDLTGLRAAEPREVSFPESTASAVVNFTFRTRGLSNVASTSVSYALSLKSERGATPLGGRSRSASTPATGAAARTELLQVIGTPPPFLTVRPKAAPGRTLIQGLAPGRYTIVNQVVLYDPTSGMQERTPEAEVVRFEIKAGERRDLGTLIVDVPAGPRTPITRRARSNFEGEPQSNERSRTRV